MMKGMGWTRVAVVALGIAALPPVALAQNGDGEPVTIGESFTIHSEILGEDRPIQVGVPAGYENSSEPYPVVYVLDGQGHFHHTTGTVRFLSGNNRMPPAIVVAVGNISGEQRTRDMTPPVLDESQQEDFPTAGGSAGLIRFLDEEVRPWVNERYRTRDYDVLIGHSFGGLFITEVLNQDPSLFDGYISISPSLWWEDEAYVERVSDLFERHPDAKGSLYMTMGNEGGNMLAGAWKFTGTLEKDAPEGFRWKWRHMPTESHGSVPHRSTYDGLEWIFDGWDSTPIVMQVIRDEATIDEVVSQIEAHYAALSTRMGWDVSVPFGFTSQMSPFLLNEERVDDAIAFSRALVGWHPSNARSHSNLADALAAGCMWDEARRHYGHARDRAQNDGQREAIDESLATLEESVESGKTCG